MSKPKASYLYAAIINSRGGLYSIKPLLVTYDKKSDTYWDKSGDIDIYKPGLNLGYAWHTFASTNKKEVEIFIAGAKAVCDRLVKNLRTDEA